MDFLKSYENDYSRFKQRFKQAGLGTDLDAKNAWRHLLMGNKYLKVDTLKKLKNGGVNIRDLNTLESILKSYIILEKKGDKNEEK